MGEVHFYLIFKDLIRRWDRTEVESPGGGNIEAARSWLSPVGDTTSLLRTKPATNESGTSAWSPHTLTCLLRKGTQDSIGRTLTYTPANPGKKERMFGDKMRGFKRILRE